MPGNVGVDGSEYPLVSGEVNIGGENYPITLIESLIDGEEIRISISDNPHADGYDTNHWPVNQFSHYWDFGSSEPLDDEIGTADFEVGAEEVSIGEDGIFGNDAIEVDQPGYIEHMDGELDIDTTQDFSMGVWINHEFTGDYQTALLFHSFSPSEAFGIGPNGGRDVSNPFPKVLSVNRTNDWGNTAYEFGDWHLHIVRYFSDTETADLYFDAEFDYSKDVDSPDEWIGEVADELVMGYRPVTSTDYFYLGSLAHPWLMQGTISESAMEELYNAAVVEPDESEDDYWELNIVLEDMESGLHGNEFIVINGTEYLVTGNIEGNYFVYDTSDAFALDQTFTASPVTGGMRSSPDDQVLVVCADNSEVLILDTSDFSEITTLTDPDGGLFVPPMFSPNGDWLVIGTEGNDIFIYDTSDWSLEYSEGFTSGIQHMASASDMSQFIVPVRSGPEFHFIEWDTWNTLNVRDDSESNISDEDARGCGWSINDEWYALGDDNGDFRIFDASDDSLLYFIDNAASSRARRLYFFDDDNRVVHANRGGTSYAHNYDDAEDEYPIEQPLFGPESSVMDWSVSDGGDFFSSGSSDGDVYVWDAVPGEWS